jgi:uncharacterized membrane protein YphA (DoxX/SURF4 family)
MKILTWVLRIIIAFILGQTLFFKFTGAPESIDLFTTLAGENEALMRYGTGLVELIAVILVLIPKTTWLGALIALGTMAGAIMGHFTTLGISHAGDGGLLFSLAVTVFVSSAILLYINRKEIPFLRVD